MKKSILSLTLLAATALSAAPALAQQAGDITLGFGLHQVIPRSDNGTLSGGLNVDIGNSTRPTFTAEYFVRDNLGIELLAALPFKHSVNIDASSERMPKQGGRERRPPSRRSKQNAIPKS